MDESIYASWRDIAIVILVLEAALLVAVPGIVFVYALRGVRALKARLRLPLLNAQLFAVRVQHSTLRASEAAIALPLALASAQARARVTMRGLGDFLRGR